MPEIRKPMKPRAFAIATGQKYYDTGKPCKWGHFSKRLTKGGCVRCAVESTKKWRQSDEGKAHLAKYRREWALKNADNTRESKRVWRMKNPEKVRASAAAQRKGSTKEQRIRHLEQMRAWHKSQPLDKRYRPTMDRRKKQQQQRELLAKYRAAFVALKELGIEI